jgi:hypothetical protein
MGADLCRTTEAMCSGPAAPASPPSPSMARCSALDVTGVPFFICEAALLFLDWVSLVAGFDLYTEARPVCHAQCHQCHQTRCAAAALPAACTKYQATRMHTAHRSPVDRTWVSHMSHALERPEPIKHQIHFSDLTKMR